MTTLKYVSCLLAGLFFLHLRCHFIKNGQCFPFSGYRAYLNVERK